MGRRMIVTIPSALIVALAAASAQAQDEIRMSDDPTYCEVFSALSGRSCESSPAAGGMSLPGITQGIGKKKESAQSPATQDKSNEEGRIDTPMPSAKGTLACPQSRAAAFGSMLFEFNSFDLTPATREMLDTVAAVLQDLASCMFVVEGHTDSVGSAAYNHALSERRANSVTSYLVRQKGISPDRLTPRGMGESRLYDQQHPTAAVNRRVVFLNAGT